RPFEFGTEPRFVNREPAVVPQADPEVAVPRAVVEYQREDNRTEVGTEECNNGPEVFGPHIDLDTETIAHVTQKVQHDRAKKHGVEAKNKIPWGIHICKLGRTLEAHGRVDANTEVLFARISVRQ
ncbi:hypothetical protein BC936DRAFT_138339, partial [Jimgerdemannia flammicorona]